MDCIQIEEPKYHGDIHTIAKADWTKCIGCGICRKICPMDRFTIQAQKSQYDPKGCIACMACIHALRPDIRFVNIRGNIDTRLNTFEAGNYDGMVLAAAGLKRLGKADLIDDYLSPDLFIPACGQGSIAIEIRKEDKDLFAPFFNKELSFQDIQLSLERKFLQLSNTDCHSPTGFYLEKDGEQIYVHAMHGKDTEHCAFVHFTIPENELEQAPSMAWNTLRGMQ